jgi:hypothetical protein
MEALIVDNAVIVFAEPAECITEVIIFAMAIRSERMKDHAVRIMIFYRLIKIYYTLCEY